MGAIIGTIVAGILFILAAVAFIAGMYFWRSERRPRKADANGYYRRGYDGSDGMWLAFWSAVVAVIVLGVYAFAMFPFGAEYHQWRSTSGVVESVASRQVSDGDSGMQTKFVIKYRDGGERGCTDTRCSLVQPGDEVELKCRKVWQWQATPGFDCNWVNRVAVTAP